MANTVSKLLEVALAEVGYLEKTSNNQLDDKTENAGSKNWTKYARDLDALPGFYNGRKNGFDWCDVFVDWCFVQAFGREEAQKLINQPNKSLGAGCIYSANYYKAVNRFHESNPQPGDQIFFWNSSKTGVAHTGLVYKVDDTKVYTVEGNTSNASGVIANGGGVAKKSYTLNNSRIYGYGRAPFDPEETVPENPIIPETPVAPPISITPESEVEATLKIGNVVKLVKDARYVNGAKIPAWVINSTCYVRSKPDNKGNFNFSIQRSGAITGVTSLQYVEDQNSAYNIEVVSRAGLNVRKGPGTNYPVIKVLRNGTKDIVIEEINGWGKLSEAKGYVSLSYVKKI